MEKKVKLMNVAAVKTTDIRDKEQLYIIVGDNENKIIINCGEKTFNGILALIDQPKEKQKT